MADQANPVNPVLGGNNNNVVAPGAAMVPRVRGTPVPAFLSSLPRADPLGGLDEIFAQQGDGDVPAPVRAAITALMEANRSLTSQVQGMKTALLSQMSGRSCTGVSLIDDYHFHPNIEAELLKHPKEHMFLEPEVFNEQLKAIPHVEGQAVTTVCNDPELTACLRGENLTKFKHWIPKQEVLWANQLRIVAYLFDILLKTNESEQVDAVRETFPEFDNLFLATQFAFLSCTSVRRKLAMEKLRLMGDALGNPRMFGDTETTKELQRRELIDAEEEQVFRQAAKRRKNIKSIFEVKDKDESSFHKHKPKSRGVFGRGRAGGQSLPHQSIGQFNNHHNHTHQSPFQGAQRGRGRGYNAFRGGRGRGHAAPRNPTA
jgi:hypothetical protein